MATLTSGSRALIWRQAGRLPVPLWAGVLASRLIVLAAGGAGALFTNRVQGWQQFDSYGLSSNLGAVGNVLAASTMRWDGIRYVLLAEHGYTNPSSTVSFPLYSLLIRVLAWLVVSPVIAGVLISVVAFTVALVLIHRITSEELGRHAADTTVLLLAFAPLSFFFTAVYTESLYLLFVVLTFYLARRQRFAWACVAATAATLSHLQGVLLVAPLAYMYWQSRRQTVSPRKLWSWTGTLLALPLLSLAGFFTYLHTQGFSWLAPITNDNLLNYGREMMTTPVVLWRSVIDACTGLWQTLHGLVPIEPSTAAPFSIAFQNVVYLVVLLISLAALVLVWRRLPREYAIFATLTIIVCTSSGVVGRPLDAYDRYMLPIFPLWMAAGSWVAQRHLTFKVLTASSLLLIFYTVEFSRWAFVA